MRKTPDDLAKVLKQNGMTLESLASESTRCKIRHMIEELDMKMDAPYQGTLREAVREAESAEETRKALLKLLCASIVAGIAIPLEKQLGYVNREPDP